MACPVVLVAVRPYMAATALAGVVERRGYRVLVPNLDAGDVAPETPCDAVVTSELVAHDRAPVVVELPVAAGGSVRLTVAGATRVLPWTDRAVDDVLAALDQHLLGTGGAQSTACAPARRGS